VDIVLPARKGTVNRKKIGNKHAQNLRRHERKYKRTRAAAVAGKCGSSYCTKATGCVPWK
jgi:hypothetical protein